MKKKSSVGKNEKVQKSNHKDLSENFELINDKKSQVIQLKKEFPQCFSIEDDPNWEIYVIDIILNDATEVLLNLKLPKNFPAVAPFLSVDKELNSLYVQDKQIVTPYIIDWENKKNSNLKDLINNAILLLNYPNSMIDNPQQNNNFSLSGIQAIQDNQSSKNSNSSKSSKSSTGPNPGQQKNNGSNYSLNPPSIENDVKKFLSQMNPVIISELVQGDNDLEAFYYNFESVKKFNVEIENLRDKLFQKAQSNSIKYKKLKGNIDSLKPKLDLFESKKSKIEELKKANSSSIQENRQLVDGMENIINRYDDESKKVKKNFEDKKIETTKFVKEYVNKRTQFHIYNQILEKFKNPSSLSSIIQ